MKKMRFFLFMLLIPKLAFAVIKPIENEQEYNQIIRSDLPTVIEFTATWCPICQGVQKSLTEISLKPAFEHIAFFKVDIDTLPVITEKEQVAGVPTFIFRNGGKEIKKEVGIKKINEFKPHFQELLIKLMPLLVEIQESKTSIELPQEKENNSEESKKEQEVKKDTSNTHWLLTPFLWINKVYNQFFQGSFKLDTVNWLRF